MKHRYLTALLAAGVLATGQARAQTVACDMDLNITDQDPNGLNVRASPDGAIVTALKARGRWVQVHVTGQSGAWARISLATFLSDENAGGTVIWKGAGWVAFSKLGVNELNPNSTIYDAPSNDAKTLLSINEEDESKIPPAVALGCDGTWLKVRVKGLVGWTQNFCSDELTTCV
jgi:hypothetical protein